MLNSIIGERFNSQASYEARHNITSKPHSGIRFQFTGLIRGPTESGLYSSRSRRCFNSQASYEARLVLLCFLFLLYTVSIHRPHTRPDISMPGVIIGRPVFQFTGLIRGPTDRAHRAIFRVVVSIHRPHTRPDVHRLFQCPSIGLFQFTGLIRGPTPAASNVDSHAVVSIHRPHTRPDAVYRSKPLSKLAFQFTGLIRGPTLGEVDFTTGDKLFQFTGLIRGPTRNVSRLQCQHIVSIHRPHTRPDVVTAALYDKVMAFQFTGLIRGPT